MAEEIELILNREKILEFKKKVLEEMGEYLIDGFASTEGLEEEIFFKLQVQIDQAVERFSNG